MGWWGWVSKKRGERERAHIDMYMYIYSTHTHTMSTHHDNVCPPTGSPRPELGPLQVLLRHLVLDEDGAALGGHVAVEGRVPRQELRVLDPHRARVPDG